MNHFHYRWARNMQNKNTVRLQRPSDSEKKPCYKLTNRLNETTLAPRLFPSGQVAKPSKPVGVRVLVAKPLCTCRSIHTPVCV